MKKIVFIFITFYYAFAIVCLPMCDFAFINDIPEMFKHCKQTEDDQLTAVDFLTEHLFDFDCFFEDESADSNEKPHKQNYIHSQFVNYTITTTDYQIIEPKQFLCTQQYLCLKENFLLPSFSNKIFRPPII